MVELRWQGKKTPQGVEVPEARRVALHAPAGVEPVALSRIGPLCEPWEDILLSGDNLGGLAWLLDRGFAGAVRLVYIDPPFASGADYGQKIQLRGRTETLQKHQYGDTLGRDAFLQFLYERLVPLRELLADDGSIMVHLDTHVGYLVRALLDEIFGMDRFVNEIVWHYPDNFQGNVRGFANNHNTLYWYRRGERCVANPVRVPLDKPVKRDRRVWDKVEKKVVAARDAAGKLIYDTYTDRKADDVWRIGQSSVSKRRSREYWGYPTQKPLKLLDRVIRAATNPGDLVLDCFSGSGTTTLAARRLDRRWIGMDVNPMAVAVAAQRLDAETGERRPYSVLALHEIPAVVARAEIRVERRGEGASIQVQDFTSPAVLEGMGLDGVDDWRALVDCIQIDPDHDGEVFAVRQADVPAGRSALVQGNYELERAGPVVAVRFVDLLGSDLVVTG